MQLRNHVVQNRHTGEQMTHWDMLNKENSDLVAFFNMSQCVICSPVWRFLYHVIAQLQMAHWLRIEALRNSWTVPILSHSTWYLLPPK